MVFLKIFQAFLAPSVFILVLILVGLILFFRKRREKTGKVLIILGVVFYYLFSIRPVADLILKQLENKYQPVQKEELNRADKLVLLLGGKEADILRGSEVLRIAHLRDGDITIIISGTDPLLPTSERALEVKKFFINRGLPEENIITEGQSRNTWESIRKVKEMVGEKPFFLVTSAYHMERAIKEFERVGANPIPAPTDFKIKTKSYTVFDYFPDSHNLRNCDLAFHEYLGLLFYKLLAII